MPKKKQQAAEDHRREDEDAFAYAARRAEELSNDGSVSTYQAVTTPEGVGAVIQERGRKR